jgi:hypothetical protein
VGVRHLGPVTGPPSTTQQIWPPVQQFVPQHVWPLWHVEVPLSQGAGTHLPFSQTGLLGSQALPQVPQLKGSSSGSEHRPPQHC